MVAFFLRPFLFAICISFFANALNTPAYAAIDDGMLAPIGSDKRSDDGNIDLSKLPDDYLEEYRDVLKNCKSRHVRQLYYDCSCLALQFLEERVDHGRGKSRQSIESSLRDTCRDTTNAAGYEYQSCLKRNSYMSAQTNPEELCSCYANSFVKMMEYYKPELQPRNISPIKVQAMHYCENPTLARKLYGNIKFE